MQKSESTILQNKFVCYSTKDH